MFNNYRIDIVNNEEILYLYIDNRYEFAKEFSKQKGSNKNLSKKIIDFIKKKKIAFNGVKIFLVVNGVIIAGLLTNNTFQNINTVSVKPNYVVSVIKENMTENIAQNNQELKKENTETIFEDKTILAENKNQKVQTENKNSQVTSSDKKTVSSANESGPVVSKTEETVPENKTSEQMVTIHRSNGSVIEMSLNEYLIGVVAAEMPASFNAEALKAQALVARTYTLRLIKDGRKLTDNVSTQAYYDNNQLKNNWGSSYVTYYNKIKNAVTSTTNEVIKYNNNYIDAVYHSTSNGRTADSVDVWGNNIPYLKSVDSRWDLNASSYLRTQQKDFNALSLFLGDSINSSSLIEIVSRTSNNSVKELKIDGMSYSGLELRNFFNLRSTDFDIEINDSGFSFTTRGYGHGVGMSQYGANGMAAEGYNYEQIIKHYYTGVTISKI